MNSFIGIYFNFVSRWNIASNGRFFIRATSSLAFSRHLFFGIRPREDDYGDDRAHPGPPVPWQSNGRSGPFPAFLRSATNDLVAYWTSRYPPPHLYFGHQGLELFPHDRWQRATPTRGSFLPRRHCWQKHRAMLVHPSSDELPDRQHRSKSCAGM